MYPTDVAMITGDERMIFEWIIRLAVVGLLLGFCFIADHMWSR